MAIMQLQKYFPRFGDVFQHEDGVPIGFTRKTLEVTGTAGKKLFIGDFIVMESKTAKVGTIPADIEAIKSAKWLGIYAGNDAHQNMNTDNPTYNHNVTEFEAKTLKQNVVVVYRGRMGVARGGAEGTTRYDSGLRFPKGTSKVDMQAVWDKLEEQDIHVLRQVP